MFLVEIKYPSYYVIILLIFLIIFTIFRKYIIIIKISNFFVNKIIFI